MPIAMLTVYEASLARICNEQNVDIILIGDSLGNVIQGHKTTLPVTIEHLIYHTQCVTRANEHCFLLSDMPFMSYATMEMAFKNATRLMQAGAMMVKLEGGEWLAPIITGLVERGIPVCGHLGLTPQSVHKLGGYKIQAKDNNSAQQLLHDAQLLEQAGAQLLVLECIPAELAAEVSNMLSIPVIGIGAGPYTDGQVAVMHDILGISKPTPKFAKNFLQDSNSIDNAIAQYVAAVKEKQFPAA